MSGRTFFNLPTGRKLETANHPEGYAGTVGVLRRADEASLKAARRNLREIPEKDVQGDGRYLLDVSSGEELEVVTSFVDLVDPKLTGVTAFTVREGLFVPLRPKRWEQEAEISGRGEIFGREATGRDPLPMPEIL